MKNWPRLFDRNHARRSIILAVTLLDRRMLPGPAGRKSPSVIQLPPEERETLQHWQRATMMAAGLVRRGRIILLLAEGRSQSHVAQVVGVRRAVVRQWARRFLAQRLAGLADAPGRSAKGVFPPEVALHVVRLACEPPDILGRSLSPWDCHALARQLIAEAIVEGISASTVRRILAARQLKSWRHHLGLHPKRPQDAAFYATVAAPIELYRRPLRADELVLSVDEKPSLRPCPAQTLPAQPHHLPNRLAHEYKRAGALNLFAAFDTRSGLVYGQCSDRKRQAELIAFLEYLDREIAETIRTIHLVCDNVSTHHGREVRQWLARHPRFVAHFTPVHCTLLLW